MKKKIVMLVAAILSIVCIFALVACDNGDDDEDLKNKNILTDAFKNQVLDGKDYTFGVWVTDPINRWTGQAVEVGDLSILTGPNLEMKNWCDFAFDFKTDKYKITKIEFNIQASEDCTKILRIISRDDPAVFGEQYKFELKAHELCPVVFDNLDIQKRDSKYGWISISSNPKGVMSINDYEKVGGYTTPWTLMNLKVYGELL